MAVGRVLIARVENTLIALEGAVTRQVTALERITPSPRAPRTLLGLISVGGLAAVHGRRHHHKYCHAARSRRPVP